MAKALLAAGWEEHDYKRHFQPFSFPDSEGGVMFERNDPIPDHHLDSWHPLEKVMFNLMLFCWIRELCPNTTPCTSVTRRLLVL